MKKKIAVILTAALLLTGLNLFVMAKDNGENTITPYWVNITSVTGRITFNSSTNKGNAVIVVNGDADVTRITATVTLYYQDSNNKWVEIPTDWEYSVNSDILAINETFAATSGTTYKAVLDADVYANGYTENVVKEITGP